MINKRKHHRLNVDVSVVIYDILNDKTLYGRIYNISEGGAAIIVNESIEVHTPIALEFELFPSVLWKNITADVVNNRQRTDGSYHIGISFNHVDSHIMDEIRKYVNKTTGFQIRSLHRSNF